MSDTPDTTGPTVAELLAQLAERDARIAELSTRDPEAEAAATVAVIEAQTAHDVAVIEAAADAQTTVIEAEAEAADDETDGDELLGELGGDGDELDPVKPIQPETDHWLFRERRR